MIPYRLPLVLTLALPPVFAACGGEGLTLPPEGEAARIEVLAGNGQEGRVSETLANPLVVRVTDSRDRPVADAEVRFSFTDGAAGGEATPATTTTDADGQASAMLELGTRQGQVSGKAEVPVAEGFAAVEAPFTATSLAADANGISLVSGNDQTGTVNTALAAPLVVQVTDAFGNPIPGTPIEWSVVGGGSVSETSNVTDANGQASVTRTLGPGAGQQTTLATAGGLAGSPVTFTHTATAGGATGVVKVSGDGQSGSPGVELSQPLVVQVLDAGSNPIPNRAVTWVIGAGGGSVSDINTTTDAQGVATTRWTLGPGVGGNSVNAVVSGLAPATFTANATAGAPSADNSEVSASPTTITVGGTSTITVLVRDASNNPVAGASVSITSNGSGDAISPASATTGSNGVATFTFSSTVAETKTISANAGGVVITDQATVTVQRASSTTRITRDEPDRSIAGETVTVEYSVTGAGGTPTGTVTITVSGGTETCSASVAAGRCDIVLITPGNPRVLTATYSGDDRFNGSTDTENHRVDPAPTANTPPTAAFTANCPEEGLTCGFIDQSTDDKGVGVWNWNFGDPNSGPTNTSNERHPSHTFSAGGTYTVTLEVRDGDGATDTETQQVTVTAPAANSPPTAGFTMTCDEPTRTCTFTDTSNDPDDDIVIWSWNFGDNTTFEGQNPPPKAYAPGGPYTVTLTVQDDDLAQDSETQSTPLFP